VPRCEFADERCWTDRPVLQRAEGFKTRTRACHRSLGELA